MQQRRIQIVLVVWMVSIAAMLSGCADSGPGEATTQAEPAVLPAGEGGVRTVSLDAPLEKPSLGVPQGHLPQKLELPSIGVETDVVEIGWHQVQRSDGSVVSEWEVADFAAGWHKNSALPGQGGNVVLSGHNNIRGAVFRKLYTMEPGDVAYLWAGGQRFTYEVEDVMILEDKFVSDEQRRENAKWIQPFDDDRLTLVSCWPEDDNTHRVVVVAKRVAE